MKALFISKPDAANPAAAVQLVHDAAEPSEPQPGWVQVRTLCSALNHLDLWMARGMMGPDIKYPAVSGSDACGVVERIGPGVDSSWLGKHVVLNAAIDTGDTPRAGDPPPIPTPNFRLIGEHFPGVHAERFLAPVANLAAINDAQDPAAAAAFGLTHLTAYSMMVAKAGLRPGQSVLITGIGGGVALAALSICRHLACPAIVTSRHAWKLEKAKALGAAHAVLDTGQDWSKDVRALTGKRGVDLAVDTSGKATHLTSLKCLARGGAYVTAGATSGTDATTDLARLFWMQLRIIGSTMASNAEFQQVAALFRAGVLPPVIDRVYPASQATGPVGAWARLATGEQFGKIVIDWRA